MCVYLYLCVNVTVHVCVYVCACVSMWYAKYLWHVHQRVQNVKMVSVSVCACVCECVCVWYATYKLIIFGMFANEPKSTKCEIF